MRHYSNTSKQMSLSVAIDLDDTSMVVNDASGLPTAYPFNVAIDFGGSNLEIVSCTNVASNVLTIVRGQEDTAAASHTVGAVVVHAATALDFQDTANHINASVNVHGVGATSSVVGTQNPQTIFNKNINGANGNTFANIPRTALTGSEGNLTVTQTNAGFPGIDLIPASTPTANILNSPYLVNDTAGVTRLIGKTAAADVLRIYNVGGTTIRARIDETGRAFTIGLTCTGSITATGQSLAAGATSVTTLGTSGLLTMSAGFTLTGSSTGTVASGSAISISSGGTLTVVNGATLSVAGTLSITSTSAATVASGGSLTMSSGSTLAVDGNLTRSGATGRLMVDYGKFNLSSNTVTAGAANSIQDLTGASYTFTVPAGRVGVVLVDAMLDVLGAASTTATFEILLNVDGSLWTSVGPAVTTTTNIRYAWAKSWIVDALNPGSHTIKLQYRNTNGVTSCTINGSDSRSGFTAVTFW